MQTVLLTGCAGFIGSHVSELLLLKGFKVIGVDNFDDFYKKEVKEQNMALFIGNENFNFYELDITESFVDKIKDENIDIVIHLAAKAGVRPSIADPGGYIKANISGTQSVHNFMRAKSIRKMLFASSSSIYGNNKKIPFSETDNVDNPISPYAFSKKAGELMNYTFHHLYNIDIINLRFFTVYGPRQRPDLAIHKFVNIISSGQAITLFGNGETARDYTYVADTVQGIFKAMQYCLENDNLFETVNLGNNNPIKLNELVDIIYRNMNVEEKISFEPMQAGDVDITYADISKAQMLLSYAPITTIDDGIKEFIYWFNRKDNKKSIDGK